VTVLDDHGTKLVALKPGSVVAAARADLRRKAGKAGGRVDRNEHYAFHRRHVWTTNSAAELLARALDDRRIGLSSGKRMTRLLYADQVLLAAALVEAQRDAPAENRSAA
jgi:hypothetical protein